MGFDYSFAHSYLCTLHFIPHLLEIFWKSFFLLSHTSCFSSKSFSHTFIVMLVLLSCFVAAHIVFSTKSFSLSQSFYCHTCFIIMFCGTVIIFPLLFKVLTCSFFLSLSPILQAILGAFWVKMNSQQPRCPSSLTVPLRRTLTPTASALSQGCRGTRRHRPSIPRRKTCPPSTTPFSVPRVRVNWQKTLWVWKLWRWTTPRTTKCSRGTTFLTHSRMSCCLSRRQGGSVQLIISHPLQK